MIIYKSGRGYRPRRITRGTVCHYPDGAHWEEKATQYPTGKKIVYKYDAEPGAVMLLTSSTVSKWGISHSRNGGYKKTDGEWAKHFKKAKPADEARILEAYTALEKAQAAYREAVKKAWAKAKPATAEEIVEAAKAAPDLKLVRKNTLNKSHH